MFLDRQANNLFLIYETWGPFPKICRSKTRFPKSQSNNLVPANITEGLSFIAVLAKSPPVSVLSPVLSTCIGSPSKINYSSKRPFLLVIIKSSLDFANLSVTKAISISNPIIMAKIASSNYSLSHSSSPWEVGGIARII